MTRIRLWLRLLAERYPLRDQWTVTLVGRYSGLRTPYPFVTFRNVEQALHWCVEHNSRTNDGCHYVPERIRR